MIEHAGHARGCPICKEVFDDLDKAWTVIAELQRRALIVNNDVRGTLRYIDKRTHIGQTERERGE